MARTVKVGLDVDEGAFVRGVDRATSAAGKFEDQLDDVTDSAKGTAVSTERAKDSVDDLGDSAKDTGRDLNRLRADAARLDRQIDETTASVRDLARAIAATSDEAARADLARKLTGEQGRLREQVSLRRLIDVDSGANLGGQLAEQVSLTFVQRLGPLIARAPVAGLNPAVLAIGAPLAAGAATVVGTAVAGAIIGGVGIGGVVGGLMQAAKDPRVKAAGAALGEDVGGMMGRASSAFVPETLGAIDTIRARVLDMEDDFARVFGASARYVDPLLDGLLDAGENALPGVTDAMEHAGPVIDSVAQGLRDLGTEVSESLSDLAPYADEGARALDLLFDTMEVGIESATALLTGLGELYSWSERLAALWTGGGVPALAGLAAEQYNAEEAARRLADGERDVGAAAAEAMPKVESLTDAIFRMAGENISSEQALIRLEDAIDGVTGAAVNQGAGIDRSTDKGKENRELLVRLAESSNTAAEAILKQTNSHELAADAAARGRAAFLKAADAMGVEEGQAIALADQLFAIPNVKRNITIEEQQALDAIRRVVNAAGRVKDIHRGIYYTTRGDLKVPGGTLTKNRWGGVYEHAASGLVNLREADVFAPVAPARYAFAEPETGGEAFIPRYGNTDRSLAILDKAASWYGARVTTGGSTVVEGSTVNVTIKGDLRSPQQLAREVGDVVSRTFGQQADLYQRGA